MKHKLTILLLPFIIAMLGLTVGYTFLHWLLLIKLHLFEVNDMYVHFMAPLVISGLVAWLVLMPRLKMLDLEGKRGNMVGLYLVLAWLLLAAPGIMAQLYIDSASGKLTTLGSINEIGKHPATKYYKVTRVAIAKDIVGVETTVSAAGRYNQDLNMRVYVVMPMLDTTDTQMNEPAAWLGVEYYKTISNRLSDAEKEAEYSKFLNECQATFDATDFTQFVYLQRVGPSDDRDAYLQAIKKNEVYKAPVTDVFTAVNKPFETRNGNMPYWLIGVTLGGTLLWFAFIAFPKTDEEHLQRMVAGEPDEAAILERNEFLQFFIPRQDFFITPLIGYLNIGVFVAMVFAGLGFIDFKADDLLKWGANYGPLTKGGEWWRLLTATFLHGGLMHLAANMYGLFFVGIFLEPLLGRVKFTGVYLLTGVLASVASIWWYEATVSVGASGAIFGLYGVFLAMLLTKVYPPDVSKGLLTGLLIFVGINLFMGLSGGVDNAAHIGGLVSGFLAGLVLSPGVKKKMEEEEGFDNLTM